MGHSNRVPEESVVRRATVESMSTSCLSAILQRVFGSQMPGSSMAWVVHSSVWHKCIFILYVVPG